MSREVVKAYSHSSLKFCLKVKVEILPNSPRYTSSCAYPWFGTSVYSTIDDTPSRQWSTATACVIIRQRRWQTSSHHKLVSELFIETTVDTSLQRNGIKRAFHFKQECSAIAQNTAQSNGSASKWLGASFSQPVQEFEEANEKWVVYYRWPIVANPLSSFLRYD